MKTAEEYLESKEIIESTDLKFRTKTKGTFPYSKDVVFMTLTELITEFSTQTNKALVEENELLVKANEFNKNSAFAMYEQIERLKSELEKANKEREELLNAGDTFVNLFNFLGSTSIGKNQSLKIAIDIITKHKTK